MHPAKKRVKQDKTNTLTAKVAKTGERCGTSESETPTTRDGKGEPEANNAVNVCQKDLSDGSCNLGKHCPHLHTRDLVQQYEKNAQEGTASGEA